MPQRGTGHYYRDIESSLLYPSSGIRRGFYPRAVPSGAARHITLGPAGTRGLGDIPVASCHYPQAGTRGDIQAVTLSQIVGVEVVCWGRPGQASNWMTYPAGGAGSGLSRSH